MDYWFTTEDGVHIHANSGETKAQAMDRVFNKNTEINFKPITNRKELTDYVKEQINVNLDELATERQTHPRSYLNIDTRNLNPSEINQLKNVLKNYGHNIQMLENGVYDYAITYKRK